MYIMKGALTTKLENQLIIEKKIEGQERVLRLHRNVLM